MNGKKLLIATSITLATLLGGVAQAAQDAKSEPAGAPAYMTQEGKAAPDEAGKTTPVKKHKKATKKTSHKKTRKAAKKTG